MRVIVTGATGQLGRALVERLRSHRVRAFARLELDLCDFVYVRKVLTEIRPDVVVNPAAFTNVDESERQPERAFWVNAYGVRNLAMVCADLDCILAHLSTDYVFDGAKGAPYTEEDAPNPLSVYGVSKLAGEYFVRNLVPRHYVVRTSGLYGYGTTTRGNVVEMMLRLAQEGKPVRLVTDHVLTPSSAADVAEVIVDLLGRERFGIYHVTNAGECSWMEFGKAIFRLAGLDPPTEPITADMLGRPARRPPYSVLAHTALAAIGADFLPPWQDALERYLRSRPPSPPAF